MTDSGYMRAKVAQEDEIIAGPIPYTIVQATQFFEFVPWIADASKGEDGKVRVSPALFQPIAADDVADGRGARGGGRARRRADRDRRRRTSSASTRPCGSRCRTPTWSPTPRSATSARTSTTRSLVAGDDAWLGERRFADFVAAA